MAFDLRTVFSYWESAGVFDILLPFILVFALVFAILEKIQMFSRKDSEGKVIGTNKGIHSIIAIALGVLIANNVYIREVLHRFLPNVAFFMVVILAFIMLISTFLGESSFITDNLKWLAVIVSAIFVGLSLFAENITDLYDIPYYFDWLFYMDSQSQAVIFFIAAMIVVYLIATGGFKKSHSQGGSS